MPEPLLAVEDLSASYRAVVALRSVTLSILPGQATAVLGPNGAGKTSLLRCISGQIPASSGRILFDGEPLTRPRAHRVAAMGIAHVPEGRQVFGKLSVEDNLRLGAYRRRDGEVKADIERMCERFPILGERRSQRAGLLSGGEQQMLAIARGLMARPRLMMLDEPSMGLAPRIVASVFEMLRELVREGISLLVVEQNAAAALDVAAYGYVLTRGSIVAEGLPHELAASGHLQTAYLGAART